MSAELAPLVQQLLAAKQGGGDMASLLAEHPDPTMRLVAQLMAARADAAAVEEEDVAAEPPPGPSQDEVRLRRKVALLRAEVRRLQQVSDLLAGALGACPLCWGDEPGCEVCDGDGGPGWEAPDRGLFHRLVGPALKHFKRHPETAASRPRALAEVTSLPDRTPSPERRDG